ncbi:MAG: aspartate aminotransferase family protein [Kiritimatiellae bacterium]|nr:aspartate aminotransferase family protein [Kiritimatiellia bacterium]MBQ6139939.1 aspartate aminotransferase family protein [Kiritimatiellia bacterium]
MSTKSEEILEQYKSAMMPTYAPGAVLASGKGVTVRDVDGLSLYDFTSGIGVHNVGHCHPKVVKAIQSQAGKLTHSSNLFVNEPATKLAAKLVELSGLGGKVFFCNSGAEANEAAIKLARKWGSANGGRYEVVTMRSGFHGRTLATLAATAQAWCQEGYDPLPVGFAYADFNDIESVRAAVNERTVAIMLEPVQGEGGVTPATEEFMKGVRALCDEKNLLMICDEVQCGMGRTGTWFAWQGYDVKPDLFTLAKAIADGIPMGALVSNAKFADVFTVSSHASTFGGNPVAAAAALAVIDVIEGEKLLDRAVEMGNLLKEALQGFVDKYDKLLEVRGKGLMVGLVVDGDPKEIVEAFRAQGLLALTAGGGVVRFLPPLVLQEDDLEDATDMMSDAFDCVFGE